MALYYPLLLDVRGQRCLIVGGGPVAQRKTQALLEAGALVRVVAPEVTDTLRQWGDDGRVELWLRQYVESDMEGAKLVCAATDDRNVNAEITRNAVQRNLLINVTDAPEEGNFITPSVIRRGDLCLSISTGGASPLLTVRLTEELEARFGDDYGDFIQLLGEMRDFVQQKTDNLNQRRAALLRLIEAEVELRALLRAQGKAVALQYSRELLGDPLRQ